MRGEGWHRATVPVRPTGNGHTGGLAGVAAVRGLWTSVSLTHEPGQYAPGAPRPCAGACGSTAGACGCEAAESHLEHSSRGPSGSRKVRVQAEVDGHARLFFRTWQRVSDGQPRVPRPVRCKISFGGDTKRCKNCSSYPEENLRNAY